MRYTFWELFERDAEGRLRARFSFVLNGYELHPHHSFDDNSRVAGLAMADLLERDLEGYPSQGRVVIYGYYREHRYHMPRGERSGEAYRESLDAAASPERRDARDSA